jgi:dihydrodipicolinate synthase/N-acetylneuraminate lyase
MSGSAGLREGHEPVSAETRRPKAHHGVIVPMVTPLADGRIDRAAAERIAERLIDGGCHPFVLGTTGEGASVVADEAADLVHWVVRHTAGRARVYAGISCNSLRAAIDTGRRFLDAGADAVVCHPPSYFAIRGEHMLRYFELLADGLGGPLFLYNIPVTTNLSIPLDVVETLSHHPHIVGLKDSEGDRDRLREAVARWSARADFSHLVGSAPDSALGLELGSDGIVPSAGNLVPLLYSRLYGAALAGDTGTAARLQDLTEDLAALYTRDRALVDSLAALKAMMAAWDLCGPEMLPPLARLAPEEERRIRARMGEWDRESLESARVGAGGGRAG